jgi:ribosome-associated protein
LTQKIIEAALENKASAIRILNMAGRLSYCDYFIVCSGETPRQVRAIADHVTMALKKGADLHPIGVEGRGVDQWVLVDFGDVLLHIFTQESRTYYGLDDLWVDAPSVPLSEFGIDDTDAGVSPDTAMFR